MTARDRLNQILEKLGLNAKRSLGQNFLVSDLVIQRILQAVHAFKPDAMIEVGPGPGALTDLLREMKLPLHLIELDRTLAEHWRTENFPVYEEDALRMKWTPLYQKITEEVGTEQPNIVFVSNLPYQISSSIVIERSMDAEKVAAQHMVLMFQKEVAQRIRALPKTENYGMLSVIAQTFWKVAMVTEAGPRDFDPPPRVASRVLEFTRLEVDFKRRDKFLTFVKAAFAQRRKLLKSNLNGLRSQMKIEDQNLVGWITEMGFKETVRAEELSPKQFVQLFHKFGFEG